jgi:D-alanyl-D-alanine carboxypeptidase (penicillin-binding protein 5/6)
MLKFLVLFFTFIVNVFAVSISSDYGVLMDYETGDVLFDKKKDEKTTPSSMTKIMTSYLIFEKLNENKINLEDEFKVSKFAWMQEGSRMFLEPGSEVSVDNLLKGLIVQSGNDATVTLVENIPIFDFIIEMNNKAMELDLRNTHFDNPVGFPSPNNYSSVYDIAVLSQNLIKKFPDFYKKYFSIKKYKWNKIEQPNRNNLLNRYAGTDGLKTGHTNDGGFGIAVSAVVDDRRLIAVVNGAKSQDVREWDAIKLLDYGYEYMKKIILFKKGEVVENVPVLYGKIKNVNIVAENDIYGYGYEKENLEQETIIYRDMIAPLNKKDKVGEIIVNNKSFNLVVENSIESVNWFKKIFIKVFG